MPSLRLWLFQIAPWATVIINGVYWQPGCPRLVTFEDAQKLLMPTNIPNLSDGIPRLPHNLIAICDISCDLGVSRNSVNSLSYSCALQSVLCNCQFLFTIIS